MKLNLKLIQYIAEYINEELDRNHTIDAQTILSAIDAFEGGAE